MLAAGVLCQAEDMTLTGAGASFPAPVYQKWTYTYSQSTPEVSITYQSIGSGAGLNQIKSGTVDFAGTDNPLTVEQQEAAGCRHIIYLRTGQITRHARS